MGKTLKAAVKKQNYAIFCAGLVLVIYIIALLGVNYSSQTSFEVSALEQFKLDAEKQAVAISYFYSERKDDLRRLAKARELLTFFENKALGMSMEYGLRASLLAIGELFTNLVGEKELNGDGVYDWIVFLDVDGKPLVSSLPTAAMQQLALQAPLYVENEEQPAIKVVRQNAQHQILVAVDFLFKEQYVGQIVAQVADKTPFQHFITLPQEATDRYCCIANAEGCLYILGENWSTDQFLSDLKDARIGEVQFIDTAWRDHSAIEMLAVRVPIQNTPFFLIAYTPATEVLGHMGTKQLLLAMGALAFIVLAGSAMVIRINTQKLVLKARYDESARQQNLLEIKNAQLSREIEKRRQGEARLHHLAHHDPLTNLPNRVLFNDRLEQALHRAWRENDSVAILFLDLDRFKNINDTMGHPIGDRLLRVVARRLASCVREADTIARLGGDEFIVIMEKIESTQEVARIAQRMLTTLAKPFRLEGRDIFLTVSIGISLYPKDGKNVTELVKNADTALYRAKEQGKNNCQFYIAELTTAAFERFALETSLRRAVERQEFVLHYQPQVSFVNDRVAGVEALVRWRHPEQGLLSPAKFIPLAEETGLIEPIGAWVLHAACAQAKAWQMAGLPSIRLAVNLSVRQIMNSDILTKVRQALEETGLAPQHLELEITESAIMHDPGKAIITLNALKALGISLVIDDFGTGYSSLSYLKRFNVSKLKIDRSFVCDIANSANDKALVRAIIALGHSIQLQVSAEGVETNDQQAFLKAEGCDERQGFLLYEPLTAEAMARLLVRERTMPSAASEPAAVSLLRASL